MLILVILSNGGGLVHEWPHQLVVFILIDAGRGHMKMMRGGRGGRGRRLVQLRRMIGVVLERLLVVVVMTW